MSSVTSYSNGQLANGTRRAWISTVGFGNNFYDYTTSMNPTTFVTTGTLTAKGLSASYPAGRVLRENGKKLYPGANPGNVYTLMVGVTDTTSFATGFIDPNSSVFALYNSDKASSAINGVDAGGSGLPDLAPPVYTAGNIETTLGNVIVDTGNVSVLAGTVTSYGNITTTNGNVSATTGTVNAFGNITTSNGNLNATIGNLTVGGYATAAKQIYSTAVVPSYTIPIGGGTYSYSYDSNTASFVQILLAGDIVPGSPPTLNLSDVATAGVLAPTRGYKIHFIVQADDSTGWTLNMPDNYKPATFAIGSAGSYGKFYGFTFVSDGANYWCVGSTGPYSG
jgi:hypothetical protein